MKSKYIIFDVGGIEYPIVFCPLFRHEQFVNIGKPIAAGFCRRDKMGWLCWGKSVGLGISSRNITDEQVLRQNLEVEIII